MSPSNLKNLDTIPAGRLGLIPLESCASLGAHVNDWLVKWRSERREEEDSSLAFEGYRRDSYLIDVNTPRFGSGEAKGVINESVRGDDIYIMVDVCNYSMTYRIAKYTNLMSPDDHFQDLKRVIAAIGGKARRINVIMPYLYESRQSIRKNRESLDCANALQELVNMGVENILTFDAHDARVQNSTPLHGFETVPSSYQFIKALLKCEDDLRIDNENFMIISPDEGSMNRRRDYSKKVSGLHPVVAHEFLGPKVAGKDVIIIDDMISSGDTMLEVAELLKSRQVRKIFLCSTFGLFTEGLEKFDTAYEKGLIDRVLTTNLAYQSPELLSRPYYVSCDMSKYIALLIDTLNHDLSISRLLNPVDRITRCVNNYKKEHGQPV